MKNDRIRKKIRILAVAIPMTLLIALPSCKPATNNYPAPPAANVDFSYATNRTSGTKMVDVPAGYEKITENSYLSMLLNRKDGSVIVSDKRTGKQWSSNPLAGSGADSSTAVQAQIRLTYQNSNGLLTVMDSSIECAKKDQIQYESVENGIKATYTFGNSERDIAEFPKKISNKRFLEYLTKLDEAEQKEFKSRFSYISQTDNWIRRNLTAITQARLIALFDKIGYTKAYLDIDNMENNVPVEMNEKKLFVIPVIYKLESDSLKVTVPMSGVVFPELFPITKLELFEYFGALNLNSDAYVFVPDGSGSLIGTSPVDSGVAGYTGEVYGSDETVGLNEKRNKSKTVLLPVFGICDKESSFLAVIEDSDAIATIEANKSGSKNSYTTVFSSYNIIKAEKITLGDSQASTFYKFQNKPYSGNIQLRYIFLADADSGYNGMARAYRDYLIQQNGMKKLEQSAQIPFYLETIGTIDMVKDVAGIKYNGKEPLTTYANDIELIRLLQENGISNINLRMTGWMNGGVEQKIASQVNFESVLGGKSGFEKLCAFAAGNNVKIYPDASFNTFSTTDNVFTKQQYSARTLNDKDGRQYIYNDATNGMETSKAQNYRIIVAPRTQAGLIRGFMSSLGKYYKNGLSIADAGQTTYSDFTDSRHYNRQDSLLLTTDAIKEAAGKTSLMLYSPNARAAVYSSTFTGVPEGDSNYSITKESIPFYQMVFHGYADYSLEALNIMSDYKRAVLKSVEYGAAPGFKWVYQNNAKIKNSDFSYLYSSDYTRWLADAVKDYNKINSALAGVRNQTIQSHERLADGVYQTTYEDGTAILVNYNETSVKLKDITIEAMGFLVLNRKGA